MSQFQTFGPGSGGAPRAGQDPLMGLVNPNALSFSRLGNRQNRGPQGPQRPVGGYQRYDSTRGGAAQPSIHGGPGAQYRVGGQTGMQGQRQPFGIRRQPDFSEQNQAAIWDALQRDMQASQQAANQQFQRNQQQIQGMEGAIQRGMGTFREAAEGQRQGLRDIAGSVEGLGDQARGRFEQFRDQQMGQLGEGIEQANRFAAEARESYEKTISNFRDTSAQDAANAAFGMRRNVQSQLQMMEADPNMSPAEKQAARMQMMSEVEPQVAQTVGGIFSNMNQQIAGMGANLANIIQSQSQTAMAGAQLGAQAGQAFGAQTLQSEQMGMQMRELGANIRTMGENAYAAALSQIPMFELQGRTAMAQFVQQNQYSPISIFTGLAAGIQAATTPGLGGIRLPGARA